MTRPVSLVLKERLAKLESEYARLNDTGQSRSSSAERAEPGGTPDAAGELSSRSTNVVDEANAQHKAPSTVSVPAQPPEMSDRWWELDPLILPVRDHL